MNDLHAFQRNAEPVRDSDEMICEDLLTNDEDRDPMVSEPRSSAPFAPVDENDRRPFASSWLSSSFSVSVPEPESLSEIVSDSLSVSDSLTVSLSERVLLSLFVVLRLVDWLPPWVAVVPVADAVPRLVLSFNSQSSV